jgi:integrative and conjugative element protein (TIGR02256 family)
MSGVQFWAEDRRFGLTIPEEVLSRMLDLCRSAYPDETGGILVGYYTAAQDCAVVTRASEAPPDSGRGKSWFVRGTSGLQRWLDGLWRGQRHHYLGDYHSHPGGDPSPSIKDLAQLEEIANDEPRKCPELLLILIGGAAADVRDVRAYVFPRGGNLVELSVIRTDSNTEGGG